MIEPVTSEDLSPHDIPPPINELGQTKAERNRLFTILVGLILVVIIAMCFSWYAFEKAQNNKEIMFIKMFPNGTWENVTYKSQDQQLYFKTTVDSLLAKYTEKRFGVQPITIASDYGEAQVFMDNDLRTEFLSKSGFDAVGKVQQYAKSKNFIKVIWKENVHYDQITGQINGVSTRVFKTNIYFTVDKVTSGQSKKSDMRLSLSWRLLSKQELEKQDKDYLRVNPIGLTVISQQLSLEKPH